MNDPVHRRTSPSILFILLVVSFGSLLSGCTLQSSGNHQQPAAQQSLTARLIPLAGDAWAGSSVNVLAGVRQSLYTHSVHQYAAYYNSRGQLVVAKRRLGEDQWNRAVTGFTGNVVDAHNYISLVVDGDGYLHLAWDHHNNALNYARSTAPGSLKFERQPMVGSLEQSVTYPQFYHLPNGDLLLQYRDGGSGHGSLVMNRYATASQRWQRVHSALLDGEGQRSAYWDMALDTAGLLHLAWTWRETPDVASNHDLMYARSDDLGKTWKNFDGEPLAVPMTAASVEPVKVIAQNHKLMNPPQVAADRWSQPFISSYWAATEPSAPAYHVLFGGKQGWQDFRGPEAKTNFELSGMGTRRPPWSRAALLVESDWERSWFHLVYRDDHAGGAVLATTVADLATPRWQTRVLMDHNSGAWEPSFDPQQWQRLKQVQMLWQPVDQLDGNDQQAAAAGPGNIGVLVWSPNWDRHQNLHPVPTPPSQADLNAPLDKNRILATARKAADWQWQHIPEGWNYHPAGWALAPFYIGNLELSPLLDDDHLEQQVMAVGRQQHWQPHERVFDADDYVVSQAYLRLYLKHREPEMLAPSRERLDSILAHKPQTSLDWGTPGSRDRWSWSDALFMGPMSWLLMTEATGDTAYLEYMNHEWWATAERLYRPEIGLYFRDESYLDLRERNGATIHWARGTGWSIAGLAQVLEHFPRSHPDYPRYQQQFREMARAFLAAQQNDGLWRPGLLDPGTHTARETSGSAFAVFALAWGLNHGLLEGDDYRKAVVKGWNALSDCVREDGKLEHVQPIGAAPHGFDPANNEAFATGALLMAAKQVYQLAP